MLHRLSHPQIVEVIGLVCEQGIVNGSSWSASESPSRQASSRGHLCWQRLEKAFGQIVEAGLRVSQVAVYIRIREGVDPNLHLPAP